MQGINKQKEGTYTLWHSLAHVNTKLQTQTHTQGLEDQLLALVVNKERPELEETKTQLIIQNTEFTIKLKQLVGSALFCTHCDCICWMSALLFAHTALVLAVALNCQ